MAKKSSIYKQKNGNVLIENPAQKNRFDVSSNIQLFNVDSVRITDSKNSIVLDYRDVQLPSVNSGFDL